VNGRQEWECVTARRAIHDCLDGEPLGPDAVGRLEAHLSRCAACRELDADLRVQQAELRSLPPLRLSDEALRDVLSSTSRGERGTHARRSAIDWRLAAAAAITVAVVGLWSVVDRSTRGPSDAELARVAAETRAVLAVAARALRSAERAATHGVLADEVSPALRRVPIEWPAPYGAQGSGRPAL
jgi:predicted anti-sigma-YlaC factor YlaD